MDPAFIVELYYKSLPLYLFLHDENHEDYYQPVFSRNRGRKRAQCVRLGSSWCVQRYALLTPVI
jgi:hypothetical protein